MQGTSKNKINIWQEFAKETNGTFEEGYSWRSDSTTIEYKNWKIVFDNYRLWSGKNSTFLARVVVPVTLRDNFKFEIYKEGFIRKIEKLFGAQDIEIGHPEFDKAFTIKSNNELKIKTLLRNKEIRNLIDSLKDVNIQILKESGKKNYLKTNLSCLILWMVKFVIWQLYIYYRSFSN